MYKKTLKKIMFSVNQINFSTFKREKRKTMCITIKANGELILKVPLDINDAQIHDFVERKTKWVKKKLEQFAQLEQAPQNPLKTGQEIEYLGHKHKLILKHSLKNNTAYINNKEVFIESSKPNDDRHNLRLLERFLLSQAELIFHERLSIVLRNFPQLARPVLKVRVYKSRFGSYGPNHLMSLNAQLIHTSVDIIDYIITHELCHYYHKGHDAKFYNLLSQKIPHWKSLKKNLDEACMRFLL